ncbi:MAG: hypothetical protein KKB09_07240 [Nanoarchaeota archaeon]|nr:hypothetical protein [Nanoarchaeota archaeon]
MQSISQRGRLFALPIRRFTAISVLLSVFIGLITYEIINLFFVDGCVV